MKQKNVFTRVTIHAPSATIAFCLQLKTHATTTDSKIIGHSSQFYNHNL